MRVRVSPDELFENQSPIGSSGYCPTGGWVVKRSLFLKTGYFDEHLRLHQDTAMYIKFAALGQMMAGQLDKPVAMRRVHSANRSSVVRSSWDIYASCFQMWKTLIVWGDKCLDNHKKQIIFRRFIRHALKPYAFAKNQLVNILIVCFQFLRLSILCPKYIFQPRFWREIILSPKDLTLE
jgi:hypothetical protein